MFPELKTERLLLQEIHPEDQPFIFEGLSHPDIIPFYSVRYESLEATGAQMDWYRQLVDGGTGLPWKMIRKETEEKIGVLCVYHFNPQHRKAEVGFWLLPQYWNRGYAMEALQAAIAYWQDEKALHRMEAFVESGNTASSKLLEKAGFQYEGTMHDCEIKEGRYINLRIYAMLYADG
jgi:ribosomal-protein-alanine N-acetyltransferase